MGATHVTVTVRNIAEPEKSWDGLFLVDTGATDCMVYRKHLEAIGLKPRGKRTYELADGTELVLDVTSAEVEFMGDFAAATIIMSDEDVEPILGVIPLESVGIEVDPVSQQLKRLPAVRLKSVKKK
jgi:clan AA aspartic protease